MTSEMIERHKAAMADWFAAEAGEVVVATVPRMRTQRDEFLASVGCGLRHQPSDAELIKTLRMEIDQQQKLRGLALTENCQLKNERDMLANHGREQSDRVLRLMQSKIDAAAAVDAIMARADEDGALHRDAMIEVLQAMGAR